MQHVTSDTNGADCVAVPVLKDDSSSGLEHASDAGLAACDCNMYEAIGTGLAAENDVPPSAPRGDPGIARAACLCRPGSYMPVVAICHSNPGRWCWSGQHEQARYRQSSGTTFCRPHSMEQHMRGVGQLSLRRRGWIAGVA